MARVGPQRHRKQKQRPYLAKTHLRFVRSAYACPVIFAFIILPTPSIFPPIRLNLMK
jgi:hypothetical protein